MKHICIIICLLLCGCKSTKIATDTHEKTIVNSELSEYHHAATIDTTRLLYNEDVKQIITIEETTITRKYDKDTGAITEETETKRKITQDTDQVVAEEETKGIAEVVNDSTHHIADASKMIDSSIEEEATGGQESFGKWLGIVIGMAIVIFIVYLLKKLRVI